MVHFKLFQKTNKQTNKQKKQTNKNYPKGFASSHPYSPWEFVALEANEN